MISLKNKLIKNIIKGLLFLLIFLLTLLIMMPLSIGEDISNYPEYTVRIISRYYELYFILFIGLSFFLGILSMLFPGEYKDVKKISGKELINTKDFRSKVPRLVYLSLLATVILVAIAMFIFVK